MPNQQNMVFRYGTLDVCLIAGAWTLFHIIWILQGQAADDYWGQALLVLFAFALVLAFKGFAQERLSLTASTPVEEFPEPAITRFFFASTGASALWFALRMNVGAQWFTAGWEKLHDPSWGSSGKTLTGFVSGAISKSSGANPSVQGWYANFLQNIVLPHAGLFSVLVSWGELAVGLGVLLGALTGIAAGFGVLMNLNYLLAGTVGINPILGMFGLFLGFSWSVCDWVGLDHWLLPALGLPWKPGELFQSSDVATTNQLSSDHG